MAVNPFTLIDDAARVLPRVGRSVLNIFRGGADDAARAADDAARAADNVASGGWRQVYGLPANAPVSTARTVATPAVRAGTAAAAPAATTRQARRLAAAAANPRGRILSTLIGPKTSSIPRQIGRGLLSAAVGGGTLVGLAAANLRGEQQPQPFDVGDLNIPSMSPTEIRLQRLNQAEQSINQQLDAQQAALDAMLSESEAADAAYANMLGNYRTNTMRDIEQAYGRSAEEALRAAQQIEGIGSQAAQDITGEGAATAAALQALAEAPAEAGTGMFTGLVPVSGDLADAPQAAANAANITAQAAQRGVNITRDDLRAAAAMAPMVSEAYGRQVDSQTAMSIALAQIAGQKERAQQRYEETSRISGQRAALTQEMAAAQDEIVAEGLALVSPDNLPLLISQYQTAIGDPNQAEVLASLGINSFADYVSYVVGPETFRIIQSYGSQAAGS